MPPLLLGLTLGAAVLVAPMAAGAGLSLSPLTP